MDCISQLASISIWGGGNGRKSAQVLKSLRPNQRYELHGTTATAFWWWAMLTLTLNNVGNVCDGDGDGDGDGATVLHIIQERELILALASSSYAGVKKVPRGMHQEAASQ